MGKKPAPALLVCTPRQLPAELRVEAAQKAIEMNPANAPTTEALGEILKIAPKALPTPEFLALLTSKYWGPAGVNLSVGFLESVPRDLADRIVSHMNAWGKFGNIKFTSAGRNEAAQVRITLNGGGYWSYLGTDILSIPDNEPTMSLQGFSMNTPESEYKRVVRHETGHTLGCPHEHLRREIVERLDARKTIQWGARVLGWDERTVRQQILTPLDPRLLTEDDRADQTSIMCYQLPAEVTRDGRPIPGGTDIDAADQKFIGQLYPLKDGPINPPGDGVALKLGGSLPEGEYLVLPADAQRQECQQRDLMTELADIKPDQINAQGWIEFLRKLIEVLAGLLAQREAAQAVDQAEGDEAGQGEGEPEAAETEQAE